LTLQDLNADAVFTPELTAAGERLSTRPWTFVKSVVALDHLPEGNRIEIAFAGRSNVGKSSLLNALIANKGLARTSNTPGRTQELNYFRPDNGDMYLVDMPGYGFAKAPKDKVEAWTRLVRDYLKGRQTLARVFLLIDARHGLKDVDSTIMEMLDTAAVSYQIVLTKADKINPYELADMKISTGILAAKHPAAYPVMLATSSETGAGIAEVRAQMAMILEERGRPVK
jgi:GTP-binding protein